jgi:DNA-binding NarL/FixJ family response regulator
LSNVLGPWWACLRHEKDAAMRDTLIVLEHQALMREALVALLSGDRAPARVQGACSLTEAAPLMAAAPGCVLLLAVEGNGPDTTLDAVRLRFPAVRIVALAATETRDGVLRCLAAGAHGFVAKTATAAELVQAVRVVEGGGVHVPSRVAASGPVGPLAAAPSVAPVVDQLTGRQRDVLLLMAEGRSTKDIARTLDLAVSTIKVHLAGVYRTVGARNRVEALCRAGLLPQKLAA